MSSLMKAPNLSEFFLVAKERGDNVTLVIKMLDNWKLSGGCQVVTDWSSDLTEASVYVQVIYVSQKNSGFRVL